MAAQNPGQHSPLERDDVRNYYNAGTQQHNSEFRTLGDRANAFLLTQSIFFTALILTLIYQDEVAAPFIIMAGIILLGISFCMLYIRAGRAGAYSAYAWRQYLLHLENEHPDAPWNWFAKYFKGKKEKANKEAKCCVTKCLMHHCPSLIDESALAECLPLPSSWIFSTSAFLAVWACVSIYVLSSYGMSYYHQTPTWPIILIIVLGFIILLSITIFAVYLLHQAWKEWKHPYSKRGA